MAHLNLMKNYSISTLHQLPCNVLHFKKYIYCLNLKFNLIENNISYTATALGKTEEKKMQLNENKNKIRRYGPVKFRVTLERRANRAQKRSKSRPFYSLSHIQQTEKLYGFKKTNIWCWTMKKSNILLPNFSLTLNMFVLMSKNFRP